MDLLRVSTAGSVDDGKSTLLGRLLYDTKSIFEDQLTSLRDLSRDQSLDLALVTDGLRAEREQKITIDVAYRYFATPRRKFILADTPGHFQYTRNMVTGASTAELAVVLIDARKGVTAQSRRHGYLASLLGVRQLLVAINKMDLVDYQQEVFAKWRDEYAEFARRMTGTTLTFIPISALQGDNVVNRSRHMSWYQGPTLLQHLESAQVEQSSPETGVLRFPVQYVVRPHQDFRGLTGQLSSGQLSPGDQVKVFPSGLTTRLATVSGPDGKLESASAGQPVVLTLEDEVDVSRGDLLVKPGEEPRAAQRVEVTLCWMSPEPLKPGGEFWIQHTTRRVKGYVEEVRSRVNMETVVTEETDGLELNDIGRVVIRCTQPLYFDTYTENRATGNLILIDPVENNTVGAGIIEGEATGNVVWEPSQLSLKEREAAHGHKAAVVWLSGLSGSGKSTIARALERRLFQRGSRSFHLDGDNLRRGLNSDLQFSSKERSENLRRAGEVARLAFEHGQIVLASFISPQEEQRSQIKTRFPEERFFLFHVDCSLEVCRNRDPKGLYQKADRGEIEDFTGVSAPYQSPLQPAAVLNTEVHSVDELVDQVMTILEGAGIFEVDD